MFKVHKKLLAACIQGSLTPEGASQKEEGQPGSAGDAAPETFWVFCSNSDLLP